MRPSAHALARRTLLGSVLTSLGALVVGLAPSGCSEVTPKPVVAGPPPPAPKPDLHVPALTDLLTIARLEWLILIRPEELMALRWLRPSLARVLRDDRLDLLARATSIDLRAVPELALASYRPARGAPEGHKSTIAYFVRHRRPQLEVERKFRERLTSRAARRVVGHQLLSVGGNIGLTHHALVAIGPDVVGFQYGGDVDRGPARIALLYGQGKLATVPKALQDPTLGGLHAAMGHPPLVVLLPGPFEGPMARGARGLLGAATGLAAGLTPTQRETLRLQVLLAGDFEPTGGAAADYLEAAWHDLVTSDLGHLLGLHEPKSPAAVSSSPIGLGLVVELDPAKLLSGLSAATVDNVREMMKHD
jgi:hypothetical protein